LAKSWKNERRLPSFSTGLQEAGVFARIYTQEPTRLDVFPSNVQANTLISRLWGGPELRRAMFGWRLKYMKKMSLVLLALVLCSIVVRAKQPSSSANFSGNWVLDFNQTKNPPAGLQSYNMAVKQDQQELKVETSLKGDLQPAQTDTTGYPGGSSGGYPGGRGGMGGGMGMPGRGGIGMPGGGMGGMGMPRGGGMPGGGGGGRAAEGRGTVAAYEVYPQSVVYKLDGSASTAQLGDREQTEATSKAELDKNGEALKLSLLGNENAGQRGGKIQVKEEWRLSQDGKSLRVDRSVKSPEGSGTVHLVFLKREVDSSRDTTSEPQ
jgi:hypothetical protein